MAIGIAQALEATFAVCNPKDIEAWEKEINDSANKRANGDPELTWLKGTDTGISSVTIFSVLSLKHGAHVSSRLSSPGIPHDPDDFGRCHRLLLLFPDWRQRLPEVSAQYPQWAGFIEKWDILEDLWKKESSTGKCPLLYTEIKRLEEERKRDNEELNPPSNSVVGPTL
jgi:hypothetical protein